MPFRIGALDIAAAIVVFVVIVLPGRALQVNDAYSSDDDQLRAISLHQARLAADPGDAEAAAKLAESLTRAGQTDWAVQVAGEASRHSEMASWRAFLAISTAHAERIEVGPAYEFARKALEACAALGIGPDGCPGPVHARLSVYTDQLQAGLASGIDPRLDPQGFQDAVLRAVIMVRVRGATPRDTNPDPPPDPDNPDDESQDEPEGGSSPDGSGGSQ